MDEMMQIPISVIESALNAMASRDFNAIDSCWAEIRNLYDEHKANPQKTVSEESLPEEPKPIKSGRK